MEEIKVRRICYCNGGEYSKCMFYCIVWNKWTKIFHSNMLYWHIV